MPRTWKVAIAVTTVLFVAAVLAVTVANGGDDAPARSYGELTKMEGSGEMHDLLEQHRVMIERMQEDASPAMLELMNKDPMWRMMRSPEWARMDEQHQQDIDRMLSE